MKKVCVSLVYASTAILLQSCNLGPNTPPAQPSTSVFPGKPTVTATPVAPVTATPTVATANPEPAAAAVSPEGLAPGQITTAQAQSLLEATAPAAAPASAAAAQPSVGENDVAQAVQSAFTQRLASDPSILTSAQVQTLTAQITAFVTSASSHNPESTASAWNTLVTSIGQIKVARLQAQQQTGLGLVNAASPAPATAAAPGLLSILGAGGTSLISDVLGILSSGNVTGAVGAVSATAVQTASTVASSTMTTLSQVLAEGVGLVQAALSLDPAKTVSSATTLVNTLVNFVL